MSKEGFVRNCFFGVKNKSRVLNKRNKYCVLRGAVDEAKVKIVLFPLVVDAETPGDLIFEVVADIAGVVEDLDLPHSGDAQQQVLVVDEGLVSGVQGLVIVPFRPVEAIQQRALSILFGFGQWTVRHSPAGLGGVSAWSTCGVHEENLQSRNQSWC